ncbi:MAG: selenocysteine-specific translation elongation factor, partial [bacterium]
ATIIDVPGHEKFIRNMVAGVSTIDLVLFVVAADDGVMPQSREHLDILKILQVKHGIIVITKIDLVEEDWLALVEEDVRSLVQGSFLQQAPVYRVSSTTGQGIAELEAHLSERLARFQAKRGQGIFWLPVDRSFSMKGFGTVVTGSVLSGQAKVGDSLELLPQKKLVKVRGIQSHGHPVQQVAAGDRAAINLQAIDKSDIVRGDVLAEREYFSPSLRFDARLQLLESAPRPLKPRTRVRLHVGTSEVMARVTPYRAAKLEPGESGYVQIYLEREAVSRRLDPFVIRQYSPTITIGGGVILDANAPRRKISDPQVVEILQNLEKENPLELVEGRLLSGRDFFPTLEQLSAETAIAKATLKGLITDLQKAHKVVVLKKSGKEAAIHVAKFEAVQERLLEALDDFHQSNPTRLGLGKGEIQKTLRQSLEPELLDHVLEALKQKQRIKESSGLISLKEHAIALTPEQQALREKIVQLLLEEGFTTSSEKEMAEKLAAKTPLVQEVLAILVGLGEVIRLEDNLYFHPQHIEACKTKVLAFLNKNQQMTVSQFKDLVNGTSRKYAVPLLIYLDGLGITERSGDVRILGSRYVGGQPGGG